MFLSQERAFPWRFSSYDKNRDDQITKAEFAAAVKSSVSASKKVFSLADKNSELYRMCHGVNLSILMIIDIVLILSAHYLSHGELRS